MEKKRFILTICLFDWWIVASWRMCSSAQMALCCCLLVFLFSLCCNSLINIYNSTTHRQIWIWSYSSFDRTILDLHFCGSCWDFRPMQMICWPRVAIRESWAACLECSSWTCEAERTWAVQIVSCCSNCQCFRCFV